MKTTGSAGGNNLAVSLYHIYTDHLDTPRVVTRGSDEAIVWRWDGAEAFGASAPNQNPNGQGVFVYNQRFAGQVFDAETGNLQNWHREYNARGGRYLESDPIGLKGGINTYAYVDGNPISFSDPYGLQGNSGPAIDTRTGYPIGRIVVDSKGNAMIEPVGGNTVPAGKGGVDTHTTYPNGSNYNRLNPVGHGNNPTPHGHAHLPGTGPGKAGQGPSLDINGKVVPFNSAAAHFPIRCLGALGWLGTFFDLKKMMDELGRQNQEAKQCSAQPGFTCS